MRADGRAGPRAVLITGASAGLGAALARRYAGPERVLALAARRSEPLQAVARQCEALGATVDCAVLDVTDAAALSTWMRAVDARYGLDLVIANAGIFSGLASGGSLEQAGDVQMLVRTNLEGAILTAATAAELMRPRRSGRIALIASLAARHPLADAPAYSATKAGLVAYGEALRERLLADNVGVSIVLPGHIDTAQTASHGGPLPLMLSAEAAAAEVEAGVRRGASTISFPKPLVALIGLGRLLPWRARAWLARRLRLTDDGRN